MSTAWWKKLSGSLSINRSLLPIKCHFFMFFAALSGVWPLVSVFARDVGISASVFGVFFTIVLFVKMIAKPIFGVIGDRSKKFKTILLILIFLITVGYLAILLIPPRKTAHIGKDEQYSYLWCLQNSTDMVPFVQYNSSCVVEDGLCEAQCNHCHSQKTTVDCTLEKSKAVCESQIYNMTAKNGNNFTSLSLTNLTEVTCMCGFTANCSLTCLSGPGHCFQEYTPVSVGEDYDDGSIFLSLQLWTMFLIFLVTEVANGVVIALTDAICYEKLEGKEIHYGKQRLWGTVGWGIFAIITGLLRDLATGDAAKVDYSPAFYVLAILMLFDLVIVARTEIKIDKYSSSILSDVGRLLIKPHITLYVLAVFVIGGLSGLIWSYQFLFLEELGASQLLLGLVLGTQTLLAEVPLLFVSGWIINKIGSTNAVSLTFLAFAGRFIAYFFISNPWWMIPVELTHGQTFGVFYAAMTHFAKFSAPEGTEATMQGLLGGVFEGLGVAVGTLVGGIGFDKYGARNTYLGAGIFSAVVMVLFVIVDLLLRRTEKRKMDFS